MQEGILSLMQMPRTVIAVNSYCKTNLPFLSILTDPQQVEFQPLLQC